MPDGIADLDYTPITFAYAGFSASSQNVYSCERCGALVMESNCANHIYWHGDVCRATNAATKKEAEVTPETPKKEVTT